MRLDGGGGGRATGGRLRFDLHWWDVWPVVSPALEYLGHAHFALKYSARFGLRPAQSGLLFQGNGKRTRA
jgi:hypothetical protein